MVINPVKQQTVTAADVQTNTQEYRQLAQQLEQGDSHAAEKYHHRHFRHAGVV
ncbi:hypothetical protein D9M71_578520 [compost metagenome]